MLETTVAGVKLKNPTILASGILGIGPEILKRVADSGAGAVTTKSIGPRERAGHANPTVVAWGHGLLNAVGLPSPGYENMKEEWEELSKIKVPVIASIYGATVDEFRNVAAAVAKEGIAAIEVNISCPNTDMHGQTFGCNPESSYEVIEAVKEVAAKKPVIAKLSPNTHLIVKVGKACEEAGADALTAINTVQGMLINIKAKKPILHYKKGGISGPAIKPVAIRCIYDLYENVKIPIIGVGGVTSGEDAIELIEAGATAVGIGTAVYSRGVDVFKDVCDEMKEWMRENGYKNLNELRGAAHG